MAQVRELLAFKRENKPKPKTIAHRIGVGFENAIERAFCDHLGHPNVGKTAKPLSRLQRFKAREAKREVAA
jgi:hypothetical protein